MHANRLIHETSPYLLQHARNPVDWYPWGTEALAKAKTENKPILLSIGYSACHWCHVMEHESFEDAEVAAVMNRLFVCIKVDREERPDLDKIYQTAHQIIAQRGGGWPLTMFLSPDDQMPFFGGTYFPKTPRYQLPGFVDLLERVAQFYRDRGDDIRRQNAQMRDIFASLVPAGSDELPQPGLMARALEQLKRQYDPRYGGFGQAPKFPNPSLLELCLRGWARSAAHGSEDKALLDIALHTLRRMALGGIHDHVGGGFCRYSVDERWMIPHFEKMLYDNGQLLTLYADAYGATADPLFARAALGIAGWVQREMQSPDGGYYSSLDADSEGHEGKYYVWDTNDVQQLLDANEWRVVQQRYRLDEPPNFEGHWHLHSEQDDQALAAALNINAAQLETLLASAHAKLYASRERRVRPGRDDKILASWNALMIKGMARAAVRLGRPELLASAQRAFDFVRARLWRDGRLLAVTKDGKSHLNAYLDDYAFLIDAGLELLQAEWRDSDLAFVQQLATTMHEIFQDREHGGFYFTSDDHEQLVYRPKPSTDEAIPSGNGIAALTFGRLGHLLGDSALLDSAQQTLRSLAGQMQEYPAGHASLLLALDEATAPPETIVVRGARDALAPWLVTARTDFVPWRLVFGIPDTATNLPGVLATRRTTGAITAYVCHGIKCLAPITDLSDFQRQIQA